MTKHIFFRGCPGFRENEVFRSKGLEFHKGYVYPVSDTVYEWLKALRGFETCKGVATDKIVDFPEPKKEYVASSYKRTYGPKHGEKKK